MKYLILLLLVSCASKPNCTVKESGEILNSRFTILECTRPVSINGQDMESTYKNCLSEKNENGKYLCFVRN